MVMLLSDIEQAWHDGHLGRGEYHCRLIEAAGVDPNLKIWLQTARDEVVDLLTDLAVEAPWTDKGFEEAFCVFGGTFSSNFDWKAYEREAKKKYRAGIEALREALGIQNPCEHLRSEHVWSYMWHDAGGWYQCHTCSQRVSDPENFQRIKDWLQLPLLRPTLQLPDVRPCRCAKCGD